VNRCCSYLIALSIFFVLGCGPMRVDPIIEIDTSETAFVVPLEGDSADQGKFDSVALYEEKKIAAKRIVIPQRRRKTGRMPWSYEWIPTVRVIRVNRAPKTAHWTDTNAICVESKDSINFCVGVDITAEIAEEDASTFLFNYGEKDLGKAIGTNVRSFAVGILSREFGNRNIDTEEASDHEAAPTDASGRILLGCKEDKARVSQILVEETRAHFAEKGITITNMGLTGGLEFKDESIQEAINRTFVAVQAAETAEADLEVATNEARAATERAKGEADAAKEFARAAEARKSQARLSIETAQVDIQRMEAEARLKMAEKWDGKLPATIMPADSPMLTTMGLTAATP